ncbi:MAG: GAF domain-containing protein, partial [bacterium]|nr:GAF domain-containing protein [bacterium]
MIGPFGQIRETCWGHQGQIERFWGDRGRSSAGMSISGIENRELSPGSGVGVSQAISFEVHSASVGGISDSGQNEPMVNSGGPATSSGRVMHSGLLVIQTSAGPSVPSVGILAVSLLNAIGEGVALCTRSGETMWSNDIFQRLSGAMRERIAVACRQFDREHPVLPHGAEDHAAVVEPRSDILMADENRFFEVGVLPAPVMTLHREDGVMEPMHGLVVAVRDVTVSKRLQHKMNAIDQAGGEILKFEADAVRKFNAHERLKLIEEKIIRYARDLLSFDHFAIRLLDERSGKLELVMGYGLPPEFDSFEIRPALEGHGISGYVAASGRSYVCADTNNDPLYLPGITGARSSITVPLRLHDKVIGIMNVESLSADAFDEEDRQLGEIFARYIALALHMLDLLVVERSTTNQTVSGRMTDELAEPLQDIAHELDLLQSHSAHDDETRSHLDRIERDLESIRSRIQNCAAGPSTLLGVEQALADKTT